MSFLNNICFPSDYSDVTVIAREAGEEMLSRLEWMTLKPKEILSVGWGRRETGARLQERYTDASVLSVESTEALHDQSIDLLFANLVLPWHQDFSSLLREWHRLLRPDGLLMLSALGLDTLQEWRDVFNAEEIPRLLDMHDLGDLLLQERFADPVVDVNHCTLAYREKKQMLEELRCNYMWAPQAEKLNDQALEKVISSPDTSFNVTYEIIYAHAFAPAVSEEIAANADGVAHVPIAYLRQRLRAKG